jgi:hypothetical protein
VAQRPGAIRAFLLAALDGETYPIRQTSKSKLKQIDFRFEDRDLRGLEQNPSTKSRRAKLVREGKQVMQFLERGVYIAVVADGKVHLYKRFVMEKMGDSRLHIYRVFPVVL